MLQGMGSLLHPEAMERSVRVAEASEKDHVVVSMGPQHPSTHGVLRVSVKLNGERIVDADPEVGFLHRCFEKISEGENFGQVIPHTDRTDYLAQMSNEFAVVTAFERLVGVTVPERAEYIRILCAELQRIASHLMWFGAMALDLGATTAFLYAWREREVILDLFEQLTGVRMMYNYFRIGGVRNELTENFLPGVVRFLDDFEGKLKEYHALVTGNPIFQARTKGIAIMDPATAIAWGASGPTLRGSGVNYDIRKDHPYSLYERFDFKVPLGTTGDVWDRYVVRMQEMEESVKILRQVIDGMPDGDVMGEVPRRIKAEGDVYARVESPRGETGVYVVGKGDDQAYRLHWRAPSFVHLQLLPVLGKGLLVADMVALIGSIDVVLGEVDR